MVSSGRCMTVRERGGPGVGREAREEEGRKKPPYSMFLRTRGADFLYRRHRLRMVTWPCKGT